MRGGSSAEPQGHDHGPGRPVHDLVVSLLATLAFLALSVPAWWEFSYWAERPLLWVVYLVVGPAMAFYVTFVFLRAVRILLRHGDAAPGDHHG